MHNSLLFMVTTPYPPEIPMKQMKIKTGNQMVAEGAIYAGCRFFAGYPITPASGIYKTMIEQLPAVKGCAVSSPDEISALAYCVGAAMRGTKAMTATSGPGWSLMIETVQYALITETPLVIAMVQRLGPCTGGATQGAQGDIWFSRFITSGGYTIPVIYPTTAAECFPLTVEAFNWAEKYRTPVVLLSDKEIGMTSESVDYAQFVNLHTVNRVYATPEADKPYLPYEFSGEGDIAEFAEVGGDIKVTATGSAHNFAGDLKKNDPETLKTLVHLEDKIQAHKEEMVLVNEDYQDGAETLILSFGVTARAARQAVKRLRAQGEKVNHLVVYSLFPVPEAKIKEAAARVKTIIIPEENMNGQYRVLIEPVLNGKEVKSINKVGAMITPDEIAGVFSGELKGGLL